MSVLLFRVDERLIHGQVVVGWARELRPRRIIVVDDDLSKDTLEQSIYRTAIPDGIEADFWGECDAVAMLPAVLESPEPAIVLTADLPTMARLARVVAGIEEINVGCIHRSQGGRRVLPYVCLDEGDERLIAELEGDGVRVVARDVPTAAAVRLVERERG
ncbi:MAG TPA: PTS sugar transporter subunit IIB [Gemmatimonadota bacterium]|nr:PTS sugar transporter subunit IIB [Gemmatimonadota bacterium]